MQEKDPMLLLLMLLFLFKKSNQNTKLLNPLSNNAANVLVDLVELTILSWEVTNEFLLY